VAVSVSRLWDLGGYGEGLGNSVKAWVNFVKASPSTVQFFKGLQHLPPGLR